MHDQVVTPPVPSDATQVQTDICDQLTRLQGEVSDQRELYVRAARLIAEYFQSPYVLLQVQTISRRIEEEVVAGKTPAATWRHMALGPLLESLSSNRAHAPLYRHPHSRLIMAALSVPLRQPQGTADGGITVIAPCASAELAAAHLAQLQSLFSLVSRPNVAAPEQTPHRGLHPDTTTTAALIAADHSSLYEMAFAITNGFKSRFGCDEVSLGIVRRNQVRILSVSGMDNLYPRSPGSGQIRQAMEECLDAGEIVCAQRHRTWKENLAISDYALHKGWRSKTGNSNCLSIPLRKGAHIVGILSLRRKEQEPFSGEDLDQLQKTSAPLGPALLVSERAARGLVQHLADAALQTWRQLLVRGPWVQRLAMAVAVLALLVCVFGQATFSVSVPCRFATQQSRLFTAPLEGVIESVSVKEGDEVAAGTILFQMDTRDLQLQRNRLQAQQALSQLQLGEGLKKRERAQIAQANAELRAVAAELQIVDMQLEQAVVRATQAGTITEGGDLQQRVGEVVAMGETVLRFAPHGDLMAELLIPEADIAEVQAGQAGMLVVNARPELPREFDLLGIDPTSDIEEGRNVYVAQARLAQVDGWERLGMEGVAHIRTGSRPIWWILLHRPLTYLRRKAWEL